MQYFGKYTSLGTEFVMKFTHAGKFLVKVAGGKKEAIFQLLYIHVTLQTNYASWCMAL